MVVRVEVDLPKLLYGHNGRLIKNQVELDHAFARLKPALRTVCHPASPGVGWYPGDVADDTRTFYTRIDLVWQFDLAAAFVFAALRNANSPTVRLPSHCSHDHLRPRPD